ncbi:hypothetical protein CEXT_19581 [Caerostris extrusa]|uniref:Uncharacterized protein n=1 Tax=Caerostris extrusa TaxID=172846 RepID=A0AAV4MN38_CAEEX|nr:hypothetical protein CEXT_19581 [Caerostris extrusa]
MESQHGEKDENLELSKDQQIIEWRNKVSSTIVKWRWDDCRYKQRHLTAKQKEKPKGAKQPESSKKTACSRSPESHNKKGKKQKTTTDNKKGWQEEKQR